MESHSWMRLHEEQEKALYETNQKIKQLEKYKEDYKHLMDRLKTLPDKLTHDVMVPFGDLAFMPGKIYHTNDILVLLGDNWFAERSAKQASEIAGRRMKELRDQISEMNKQRGLLEPRKAFTAELQSMAQNTGDLVEIKEEFDEQKERQWKEQHRAFLNKDLKEQHTSREKLQQKAQETMKKIRETRVPVVGDDAALWERLDELEIQETANREDVSDDSDSKPVPTNLEIPTRKSSKSVRWKDENGEGEDEWLTDSDESDVEEDYSEEEDDGEEDEEEDQQSNVLYFKHTKPSELNLTEVSSKTESGSNIISPSDIYEKYVIPALSKPKSILKSGCRTDKSVVIQADPIRNDEDMVESKTKSEQACTSSSVAFGATVQERLTPKQMVNTLCTSLDIAPTKSEKLQASAKGPTKRVSKFKQRQMQANK